MGREDDGSDKTVEAEQALRRIILDLLQNKLMSMSSIEKNLGVSDPEGRRILSLCVDGLVDDGLVAQGRQLYWRADGAVVAPSARLAGEECNASVEQTQPSEPSEAHPDQPTSSESQENDHRLDAPLATAGEHQHVQQQSSEPAPASPDNRIGSVPANPAQLISEAAGQGDSASSGQFTDRASTEDPPSEKEPQAAARELEPSGLVVARAVSGAAEPEESGHKIPLKCKLAGHRPTFPVSWNDGYYFTRCTHCGAGLVRTEFSGWSVPRAGRIRWRAALPPFVGVQHDHGAIPKH